MITFLDLQNRFLRWVDEAGDTSTTQALAQDAINASHRRLLLSRPWPFMLWPREETFTSVANVRTYALNPACGKLLSMWDDTQRQFYPTVSRRGWQQAGVDRTIQNVYPTGYTYGPTWPVGAQPASASTLSLVSSSSNDVTVTVILTGISNTDTYVTETVALNGLTPVTTTNSYLNVLSMTKTGTWVGTLTMSAGSTTLLTLGATEYGKAYPTIEFTEHPQAGLPFYYTFQRTPRTLINDYDIPETWPNAIAEIHVYDALLDFTTYNTELGAKEQNLWTRRYQELYNELLSTSDEAILGAMPRFVNQMDDCTVAPYGVVQVG